MLQNIRHKLKGADLARSIFYSKKSFSLLEILIVLAIVSVFLGLTMPNFRSLLTDIQFRNFPNRLQSFILYLRQESIIQGVPLLLELKRQENIIQSSRLDDPQKKLSSLTIPKNLEFESNTKYIYFLPDGRIGAQEESGNIIIRITHLRGDTYILTNAGSYGTVKVAREE